MVNNLKMAFHKEESYTLYCLPSFDTMVALRKVRWKDFHGREELDT
jgi:hypothetical protein